MNTIKTRLADILMLSLRPTQLMLSAFAVMMLVAILFQHAIPGIAYVPSVSSYWAVGLFGLYGALSAYCGFAVTRSPRCVTVRYGSSFLGVVLWSLVFAAELANHDSDSMIAYLMPICIEAMVIAQLTAKVREQDRRAL